MTEYENKTSAAHRGSMDVLAIKEAPSGSFTKGWATSRRGCYVGKFGLQIINTRGLLNLTGAFIAINRRH